MNKPLKTRLTKVESAPEFGNSLEVEAPVLPPSQSTRAESPGNDSNGAPVADDAAQADEERPYEFENGEDEDDAARLAALPVDDRYEEIKRVDIHIAELQPMTIQQF